MDRSKLESRLGFVPAIHVPTQKRRSLAVHRAKDPVWLAKNGYVLLKDERPPAALSGQAFTGGSTQPQTVVMNPVKKVVEHPTEEFSDTDLTDQTSTVTLDEIAEVAVAPAPVVKAPAAQAKKPGRPRKN